MVILIVNRTESLSDEKVHAAIRAINKQIAYDFEPDWGFGGKQSFKGTTGATPETDFARRDLGGARSKAHDLIPFSPLVAGTTGDAR